MRPRWAGSWKRRSACTSLPCLTRAARCHPVPCSPWCARSEHCLGTAAKPWRACQAGCGVACRVSPLRTWHGCLTWVPACIPSWAFLTVQHEIGRSMAALGARDRVLGHIQTLCTQRTCGAGRSSGFAAERVVRASLLRCRHSRAKMSRQTCFAGLPRSAAVRVCARRASLGLRDTRRAHVPARTDKAGRLRRVWKHTSVTGAACEHRTT